MINNGNHLEIKKVNGKTADNAVRSGVKQLEGTKKGYGIVLVDLNKTRLPLHMADFQTRNRMSRENTNSKTKILLRKGNKLLAYKNIKK